MGVYSKGRRWVVRAQRTERESAGREEVGWWPRASPAGLIRTVQSFIPESGGGASLIAEKA